MPRAIWSGSITFGLISLPVKAYSATSSQRVSFDLLHDEDGAHIEYRRICPVHEEVVPWEHIVKGYEIEPGKYVTFTNDELEALQPESTHTIDIEDFVRLDDIDPLYFDTPYHLVPSPGAQRAYELLHQVMGDADVVAIARVVLRTRERLVAIRPLRNGALAMEVLRYANELRDAPDTKTDVRKSSAPTEREIEMARSLVDELTVEFDADRYHDTYNEQLIERIERKAAGEVIESPDVEEPAATPVPDIMAALEASLEAARARRSTPKRQPARRTTSAGTTSSKSKPKSKSTAAKRKPASSSKRR